jgi:hypothetical protein
MGNIVAIAVAVVALVAGANKLLLSGSKFRFEAVV